MSDMSGHIHVAPVPFHIQPSHMWPPPQTPIMGIVIAIMRTGRRRIAAITINSVRIRESSVAIYPPLVATALNGMVDTDH